MTRAELSLSSLFAPSSICVIGVSARETNIGNRVLTALTTHRFPGRLTPITRGNTEINGVRAAPSVSSLDHTPDLAIVAVPRVGVIDVLSECAEAGVRNGLVLTSGIGESSDSRPEVDAIKAVLAASGMRLMGPNCIGFMNLKSNTVATFSVAVDYRRDLTRMRDGSVAIVSNSGAVGFSLMNDLMAMGVGIGAVASPGNSLDLDLIDLTEHWLQDDGIDTVALVVEDLRSGDRMRRLGDAVRRSGKTVVALRLGRSAVGQRASASHTGALGGASEVYSGYFRQHGIIEADDLSDLAAIVQMASSVRRVKGPRAVTISGSGGIGILLSDRLAAGGLTLPETSPALTGRIKEFVPDFGSVVNPIDVTAQSTADFESGATRHAQEEVAELCAGSGEYDIVVTHLPLSKRMGARIEETCAIAASSPVPVIVYGTSRRAGGAVGALVEAGVPVFTDATLLASALGKVCAHLAGPPRTTVERGGARAHSEESSSARAALHDLVQAEVADLDLGGVQERTVTSAGEVEQVAQEIGFPVAIKLAPQLAAHKTELGGVRLGIQSRAAAREAAEEIDASFRSLSGAPAEFVVQEMVEGIEALVSVRRDPVFGAVVTLGCGGIYTEQLGQAAFRLAPVTEDEAMSMTADVEFLAKQLAAPRGGPEFDRSALAGFVSAISGLLDRPGLLGVQEVEFNPVVVRRAGRGVAPIDLLVVASAQAGQPVGTEGGADG